MLTRFLMLGVHIFVPLAVICCAVVIPLCMTGIVVDTDEYANVASIMRFTLSNIEEGSTKLWVPFALSYLVLVWVGYCLFQHYKSFGILRLLHLRVTLTAGGPPSMAIVGTEQRGWRAVGDTLLRLLSPYYMLRCDTACARAVLRQLHAVEAAASLADHEPAASLAGAPGFPGDEYESKGSFEAAPCQPTAPLLPPEAIEGKCSPEYLPCGPTAVLPAKPGPGVVQAGEGEAGGTEEDYSSAAVLPWWLPPERVPREFSAAWGTSGVIAGKTCPALRKRVLARTAAGQPVWVSCEAYSLLLTSAGPPPSRELWRLLRPPASSPTAVVVEAGKGSGTGEVEEALLGDGQAGEEGHEGQLQGSSTRLARLVAGRELAGQGAELVASQLTQALQGLFPASFTQLVRVYNHRAVDLLLSKHEQAATKREQCATAVAMAQQDSLKALAGQKAGEVPEGTKDKEALPAGDVGGRHHGKITAAGKAAAARLARAEALLAEWPGQVEGLEGEVEAARKVALQQPLGTAFIALFSDQSAAALAASFRGSLVPDVHFDVRPCPGPDNLNWAALWATWWQRTLRALAVIPFLTIVMLFPIGVATGALSNLSTAVCGGTPATNSLYWPWYCQQDDFWSKLFKNLLQGLLPSLLSMLWDTYCLPLAFYFASQSELRHLALSDLDRRITSLFFHFNVFNTFLGSVLGGAVFQQIGSTINNPGYWLTLLGTALPAASTYFLNYILIHALSTNLLRFIWPHEGTVLFVIFRALGLFRPKCERDHAMIRTPPSYRGARHYGSFLLIVIMALSYAVIAPLVLPAAAGFFLTAWVTWRYSALHFYERSYESGGALFEVIFSLMVWSMSIFSTFTAVVLASKKMYTASLVLLCTQQLGLLVYHKKVTLSVGHYAHALPLQATLHTPRAQVDPAAFMPPPLRPQAVGWYPEWGKVWEKYGISRYSF